MIDRMVELGLDVVKDKIKNKYHQIVLHSLLNEYITRQKDRFLNCTREEEVDFGGLVEYIRTKFLEDSTAAIWGNGPSRDEARSRISQSARNYATANTRFSDDRAQEFVEGAFSVIYNFYREKLGNDILFVSGEIIDSITKTIEESHIKQTEELSNAISNLKKTLLDEILSKTHSTIPTPPDGETVIWLTDFPCISAMHHHISNDSSEEKIIQKILSNKKIAITGVVGGIGKTEMLRLACAKLIKTTNHCYVGWINYSGNLREDLRRSIVSEHAPKKMDPIDNLKMLDRQFGSHLVLFIDNVKNIESDESLEILSNLRCQIVVSTRNSSFFEFDMISLQLPSPEIASQIYLSYRGKDLTQTDCCVNSIVELCGFHPLTIELVAKYAKQRKASNQLILSELSKNGFDLKGLVASNWNGNKQDLITNQLCKLYKLSDINPDEKSSYILKCFCLIPSYPHSKDLVDCIVDDKNADYISFDNLVYNGWISCTETGWFMHDVVKSAIKISLNTITDDCADFIEKICSNATQLINYNLILQTLPLLISIYTYFSDKRPDFTSVRVCNNIGFVYQELSYYSHAETWLKRASHDLDELEDTDESLLLRALINNNMALNFQKKWVISNNKIEHKNYIQDAMNLYVDAKKSYEKLLTDSHFSSADIMRRLLVTENNIATLWYNTGNLDLAISSLFNIISQKIDLIWYYISLLSTCYSELSKDKRYNKLADIVSGQNDLNKLVTTLQKHVDDFTVDYIPCDNCILSSDYYERMTGLRITVHDELVPSLIRSCDAYADFQCTYLMSKGPSTDFNDRYGKSLAIINAALDLCDNIDMATINEGAAWGTLSRLHFLLAQYLPNSNAKEVAIREQQNGIVILEAIYRRMNRDQQSKEPLIRAYMNMYDYTKDEEWKKKADEIAAFNSF